MVSEYLIIVLWLVLSAAIGGGGYYKILGFWKAFTISLFFSPFVGFICVLFSKSIQTDVMEKMVIEEMVFLKSLRTSHDHHSNNEYHHAHESKEG